jgi:hypothetical protein
MPVKKRLICFATNSSGYLGAVVTFRDYRTSVALAPGSLSLSKRYVLFHELLLLASARPDRGKRADQPRLLLRCSPRKNVNAEYGASRSISLVVAFFLLSQPLVFVLALVVTVVQALDAVVGAASAT